MASPELFAIFNVTGGGLYDNSVEKVSLISVITLFNVDMPGILSTQLDPFDTVPLELDDAALR